MPLKNVVIKGILIYVSLFCYARVVDFEISYMWRNSIVNISICRLTILCSPITFLFYVLRMKIIYVLIQMATT